MIKALHLRSSRLTVEENLGDLVRVMHLVPQDKIRAAADRQKVTGEKIGEALVALGTITRAQLADILRLQLDLRSGEAKRALRALDELTCAADKALCRTHDMLDSPKTDPRGVFVGLLTDGG